MFSFGGKNQYKVKLYKPSVRVSTFNDLQNASSRVKYYISEGIKRIKLDTKLHIFISIERIHNLRNINQQTIKYYFKIW